MRPPGIATMTSDNREIALRLIKTLFDLGGSMELYQKVADAFSRDMYPDIAELIHREVLKLQPEDARSHLYLGKTLFAQERFADALKAYRLAAALNPEDAAAYWGQADCYASMRQVDLADAYYRWAVQVNPRDEDARSRLESWTRSTKCLH